MQKEAPQVVVLSRNYSTGLGVIRSLGIAGYTVDLISNEAKRSWGTEIAAASKYIRHTTTVLSRKANDGKDGALLHALFQYKELNGPRPVLFPCDDYTASIMDLNRSRLKDIFIMPGIVNGEDGSLVARMDKSYQSLLAEAAGLPVPKEWVVSLQHSIRIPTDMVYPCFCKPLSSVSGFKTEMAICESRSELLSHLRKLRKRSNNRAILIQEYLDIRQEIDFSGVCLDQEIIIPAIIHKSEIARHERGVTLGGYLSPFEDLGETCEKVIKMLREMHYVGMFDMELNLVDGKYYFNEINFRSGGPNFSYFCSGVNLPALYVKEAFGHTHTPEEEKIISYGKSFIYEKVAWEDHLNGFLTERQLRGKIKKADFRLIAFADDSKPEKVFLHLMYRKKINRKIKILRGYILSVISYGKKKLRSVKRTLVPSLRKIKYAIRGFPQVKKENSRNPSSDFPRILIVGRNYSSNLFLARAIGKAGYEAEVLRVFPKSSKFYRLLAPDAYSRYVKNYQVVILNRRTGRLVRKLCYMADPLRRMLLIPTDDLTAGIIDANYDFLSKFYHMPNINDTEGAIVRLMSKDRQKKLAEAAGLSVAKGFVIHARKGQYIIPETIRYPCFVKPNISKNSAKIHMRRCDNPSELSSALADFSCGKTVEILLEEHLEIRHEYSLLGLSTKDGVLAPGFFVTELGGHGERRGVAMTGVMLPVETAPELIEKLKRFVAMLDYEGLFDIDLIETQDGHIYFTEINFRYGASGEAITQAGLNLPGMFADYKLRGTPVDTGLHLAHTGQHFLSENIMIDEYIHGFLSYSERKMLERQADIHFLMNKQDPKPYRHFRQVYMLAPFLRFYFMNKGRKKNT